MNRHAQNITTLGFALHVIFAAVVLFQSEAQAVPPDMADYEATPPFVSNAVAPNVLLLMDNSGSMNDRAYPAAFDPAKTYNGLFVAEECYSYASSTFSPDSAANPTTMPSGGWTCTGNASYPWSGNLLNYAAQRRIDIVKYVMVGGMCTVARVNGTCATVKGQDSFNSSACCGNQIQSITIAQAGGRMPAALIPGSGSVFFHMVGSESTLRGKVCVKPNNTAPTSDSNCGASNLFSIVASHPETTTGVIQQLGTKARLGLMEFKGSGDGGNVLADVGSTVSSLVTAVETTTPSTWTPLAESLYEATRYFAQIAPAYISSDYSYTVTTRDPYYFVAPQWAGTSAYVSCCKSFVIIFTDGEPTQDLNVPPTMKDKAHAIHGSHCTGATTTTPCTPHKTNYANNGTHYLDDVAYYAHTTDLRQGTLPQINLNDSSATGKDLPGMQNLTIYTFYAFGQAIGREILQSAAKAGGFEDLDKPTQPGYGLPDKVQEWDKVINATGAAGSDGIPDTYFESADADDLRDRLTAAIASILKQSASGTAVSVLATSSTGEGALYQSFFFPTQFEGLNEIKWAGYTQGLFIDTFGNLREDTIKDGRLVYNEDYIIQPKFDSATGNVLVERFRDTSPADGKPDTVLPFETVPLTEIQSIWEAGKILAKRTTRRTILTWVDTDNDGFVDSGEEIEFDADTSGIDNSTLLAPYLRAGAAPFTSANIINFVRGNQIAGLRDRQLTVDSTLRVWKFGDPIHSTPTIVGPPAQNFDLVYGDTTYNAFFKAYRTRRQVAFVGANDGMLHAFNSGFYRAGDDACSSPVEHGYFLKVNISETSTTCPKIDTAGKPLGEELWAFIPYQLLPQLQWLTQANYSHVYYVDLKPRVFDVRVFCDGGNGPTTCQDGQSSVSHPNGWGTILIGGFRMGGSCGTCTAGTGAPPMRVVADFNGDGDTVDPNDDRYFYSAYFALDITDPEQPPKLLWSFTDTGLGLTTSFPSVLRVLSSTLTDKADKKAQWLMVVGSGPNGYGAEVTGQTAKMYAVDIAKGPGPDSGAFLNNSYVKTFPIGSWNSFIGDPVSLDRNFDYRVDVSYTGRVIHDGTLPWRGKLYRLTMGSCTATPCDLTDAMEGWGIAGGGATRIPTEILDTFPTVGPVELGPVATAPAITVDDAGKVWIFAGTGRYYSNADKTDTSTQYFVGVKDRVINLECSQTTATNCPSNDLVNVSSATICVIGVGTCGSSTNQVTGVTGATNFTSLIGLVAGKHGWYTTLLPVLGPGVGERVINSPLLLGGIVFFPSFTPTADICSASGTSNLYALFYKTGSAYSEPIIGTTGQNVNRSVSNGQGISSSMAVHIGASGSANASGGDASAFKVCGQSSSGAVSCTDVNVPGGGPSGSGGGLDPRSRIIAWLRT
jgi:type IV pilus assembly protein PilY1